LRVTVVIRGPLAGHMHKALVEVEIDGTANVGSALNKLIALDRVIEAAWKDADKLEQDALILCNDIDIGLTGGLSTGIKEGDRIVVVPLVHGG